MVECNFKDRGGDCILASSEDYGDWECDEEKCIFQKILTSQKKVEIVEVKEEKESRFD